MGKDKQEVGEEVVLEALKGVEVPGLDGSLASAGVIKDIRVEQGAVELTMELTGDDLSLREPIEQAAQMALSSVPGLKTLQVNFFTGASQDQGSEADQPSKIHRSIAIASGKGGVGKSTMAVNIAVSLAQSGASVGLLDADIYGPNIPTMMGVDRLPPPTKEKMIPAEAYGVKFISIAFLVKPGQPLIWRGPMLHSAIRQFIQDVVWGELDYMVVDLPPGTGDAALSLAQSIPLTGVVIVTLPQQVSLEDASRGLEMFRTMEVPILGVVENMSFLELPNGDRMDVFGTGGGEKLAEERDVPFLGAVPMDPSVRQSGDAGVPVVISHPDTKVAQAMEQLAQSVSEQAEAQGKEQSSNVISIEMVD